jgi:hypothetical protein
MHAETCGADWTRLNPCPVFNNRYLHRWRSHTCEAARLCRCRHSIDYRLCPSRRSCSVAYHKRYICLGGKHSSTTGHPPIDSATESVSQLCCGCCMPAAYVECATSSALRGNGERPVVRDDFAPEDEGLMNKCDMCAMVVRQLRPTAANTTARADHNIASKCQGQQRRRLQSRACYSGSTGQQRSQATVLASFAHRSVSARARAS